METHLDVNVAAALDEIGGLLGVEEVATEARGHRGLWTFTEAAGGAGEYIGRIARP